MKRLRLGVFEIGGVVGLGEHDVRHRKIRVLAPGVAFPVLGRPEVLVATETGASIAEIEDRYELFCLAGGDLVLRVGAVRRSSGLRLHAVSPLAATHGPVGRPGAAIVDSTAVEHVGVICKRGGRGRQQRRRCQPQAQGEHREECQGFFDRSMCPNTVLHKPSASVFRTKVGLPRKST
ncbi:MAG: hypothetical protein BZ138_06225 [Methanosphaera sp. rholeuAM270]|nr:MAG: hypothetical protein BZ138_06225 [Methanosphaera sp. rholeuAM270]